MTDEDADESDQNFVTRFVVVTDNSADDGDDELRHTHDGSSVEK